MPDKPSLNVTLEVGGVLGGVIGSRAEPEGEGESVLSSVRLSAASAEDMPEDPDMYVERRVIPPNPKVAVSC